MWSINLLCLLSSILEQIAMIQSNNTWSQGHLSFWVWTLCVCVCVKPDSVRVRAVDVASKLTNAVVPADVTFFNPCCCALTAHTCLQ